MITLRKKKRKETCVCDIVECNTVGERKRRLIISADILGGAVVVWNRTGVACFEYWTVVARVAAAIQIHTQRGRERERDVIIILIIHVEFSVSLNGKLCELTAMCKSMSEETRQVWTGEYMTKVGDIIFFSLFIWCLDAGRRRRRREGGRRMLPPPAVVTHGIWWVEYMFLRYEI